MQKVLITGADGFVGKYMRAELAEHGYSVVTSDIRGDVDAVLDINNQAQFEQVLVENRIEAVINLAGFSSVKEAWKYPQSAFSLNVGGTLTLLTAVRNVNPAIRVLVIGSSQEYGHVKAAAPIDEDYPLNPTNPYAMSKYAQEKMSVMLSKEWGLDVVMTRSFNHYGVDQPQGFVISDFASLIAAVESGKSSCMTIEKTDVYRDLTDVRDIARAYRLLLEKGRKNNIYNVGSGRVYHIREVLDRMISLSDAPEIKVISSEIRKNETSYVCCDNSKLKAETGWSFRYELYNSLEEILNFWRSKNKTGEKK